MILRLAAWGRPYLPRYAAGLVLLLATNGLNLWIPWLLRDAIRALERSEPLGVVAKIAALMIGVALVQAGVRMLSRWAILGASRHVVHDIRARFFEQLARLGADWYDRNRTGDVMSRGVNDTRQIQGFFGPGLLNLLNTTIVYIAVIALLLRIDVTLTLVALVLYPLLFFGVNRLSRLVYARSIAVQEQLATISNRAQESIAGIQQIKIYTQEPRERAAFDELCDEHRRRNLSMATVRGAMISLIGIVAGLGTLIVLVVGGRFVVEGRIDFGDFVAFNAYLAMLVWPTIAFGWIINTIQRGFGAMGRIDAVLDAVPAVPPALDEPHDVDAIEPIDGDVEIRGLSFAYDSVATGGAPGREVLRGIDLTIPRGSRVAIVGPVGAGKSTLANLLARFYPVPRGTIFIGGRDVADVPSTVLRRSIGYVPQEAFLFSRSLRDNVALAVPEADDAALARALRLAQLERDVDAFPDGLATVVGERGFTLSGGQRQRATLARAVLDDERRILVLDDSLSSVDADTEAAILRELGARGEGRTLILITHRLSTLAGMDRIVVLDDGRVAEQGTHEELLASGGLYATLHRRYALEQQLGGGS